MQNDYPVNNIKRALSADIISEFSALSRFDLEQKLAELTHKELGEVFVAFGGTSGDKGKPKAWLIERIVWLLKDSISGHKSRRDS